MIKSTGGKLHWNYFLALERDVEATTRYVEFCDANLNVYSIEFAHLLFAAASEVDVVAKCICKLVKPEAIRPRMTIEDYRKIFSSAAKVSEEDLAYLPSLSRMEVLVPRYGLSFAPWENWEKGTHPDWWIGYNNVKHQRDQHFNQATLRYVLNAVGALLIMNYYHQFLLVPPMRAPGSKNPSRDWKSMNAQRFATGKLDPQSTLFRLPEKLYDSVHRQIAAAAGWPVDFGET